MKKALSLIIALVLVAAMGLTAFAADTYSITINNTKEGHTYEAYQIFTGTLTDGVLSEIQWGSSVSDAGKTALGNASEYAKKLNTQYTGDDKIDVDTFIANITPYLTTAAASDDYADSKYEIVVPAAGYYLIKDTDDSLTGHDSYTSYIVQVIGSVNVDPKSSVPTVEKKVKDMNDSTDTALGSWQDSADHDVNDVVPFQLTATMGDKIGYYDDYRVIFHDTLSEGLTYVEGQTPVVTVGDNTVAAEDIVFEKTAVEGGTQLTFTIKDVIKYGAVAGSKVVVEYNAILNENSVIGSDGNPNEVYLEYSNNPNQADTDNDGIVDGTTDEKIDTGSTPVDKVIVFTYKVVVDKVKEDGTTALAGAAFTLYKYDADAADDKWVQIGDYTADETTSTFTFDRIDDGNYKLVEKTTPAGYNSIDPIYFVVEAAHSEGDEPALTSLTATQTNENRVKLTGNDITATFNGNIDAGSVVTKVVNKVGATLPSTGGIGTTIFYVVGGLLMIVAVVVLVAKKRVGAED